MSVRARLFALAYDRMSRGSEAAGVGEMRRTLLADAAGRVLEIGGGTGANLPYYDPGLEALVVTEPDEPMLRRLQRRVRELGSPAEVVRAPAEDLPFDDDSFDTVVSTLVLCGVGDQARALSEARRVLRSGGRLLFLEHVRSEDPTLARVQDRMNRLNRAVAGCECNRSTLAAIEAAGFTVTRLERSTFPKSPKFVAPSILGSAVLT